MASTFLTISGFYFADYTVNNADWTWPQNGGLWQDGIKTLFDPCPARWRVPRSGAEKLSPWSAFTGENGPLQGTNAEIGRLFDITVAYPAPVWYPLSGRRNFNSGNPVVVAGTGYGYTSTALQTKAYYFGIYTYAVSPSNGSGLNGRAEAFPVRCVRE